MTQKILLLAVFILCIGWPHASAYELRNGDIIFHTSKSSQSRAIQLATDSKYSHMGIIFIVNKKPQVFEAGRKVMFTPLEEWIKRGADRKYVVKRLRDADAVLGNMAQKKLLGIAKEYEGRPYDLYFEWSDNRIYCSELVWKIYSRALGRKIGKLQRLKEFDLSHSLVKTKLKQRFGQNIPMNELVISPGAMFKSDQLERVQ